MDATETTKAADAPVYTERTTCRACHGDSLVSILDLGTHYLPRFVEEADDNLPQAPLQLVQCAACGLLQLHHTVDPDLLYREFWYRSSVNQTMREALQEIVTSVSFVTGGTWLDIGANDGTLLSHVPKTFTRIACEPAANFQDPLLEHAEIVIPDYFSLAALRDRYDGPCDIITSAAMFYDLDDPDRFVTDVAACLSPGGFWVNQLNDAPTMLKRNSFDAVCHEHLCYWDTPSLKRLYLRHGLQIVEITHNEINGGSMRVFAKKAGLITRAADLLGIRSTTREAACAFAERARRWKDQVGSLICGSDLFREAPLWGYGASTKGSTLLQYLDCSEAFLAIADRNPAKWGLRMAGTWLPITDEAAMRKAKPKFLFVLPWSFRHEFLEREAGLREAGTTMLFPLPNFEMVL